MNSVGRVVTFYRIRISQTKCAFVQLSCVFYVAIVGPLFILYIHYFYGVVQHVEKRGWLLWLSV